MRACSVCESPTEFCCSDCRIDRKESVPVCNRTPCLDAHEAKCSPPSDTLIRVGDTTTYSNAPPLSAERVLADVREVLDRVSLLGPALVEIATNPAERLDLGSIPTVKAGTLTVFGPPVRTDPDVPPGEWWVKKSDGSHEVHRSGLVTVQR